MAAVAQTADVRTELKHDDMRRVANVESGFHQFEADPDTRRVVPKCYLAVAAVRGSLVHIDVPRIAGIRGRTHRRQRPVGLPLQGRCDPEAGGPVEAAGNETSAVAAEFQRGDP